MRTTGLDDRAFKQALAMVMPPALARLAAGFVSDASVDTDGPLDDVIRAHASGTGRGDVRAVISVWALETFETVLPTVVAGAVLLGRVPGGKVAWITCEGRVVGLRVAAWETGSLATFAVEVLEPFVARVAGFGGVSPRVLWSNAGHIVEAFVGMLEREAGSSAGTAAIRDLLAQPLIGERPNGLFAPVRYIGERRVRRVCCLRFLVPSWRICLICPLPEGHPSRRRL